LQISFFVAFNSPARVLIQLDDAQAECRTSQLMSGIKRQEPIDDAPARFLSRVSVKDAQAYSGVRRVVRENSRGNHGVYAEQFRKQA
jgi:hypothetical protein